MVLSPKSRDRQLGAVVTLLTDTATYRPTRKTNEH